MTLDDVSAVRRYAESVLGSSRSAARYIERARTEILQQKRLYNTTTSKDGKTISATCEGSHPEDRYKLRISLEGAEPGVECTCPAKEKEALCKHSLGLLLWRAGNLTEERLKRQAQAVGQLQQDPLPATSAAPATKQHGTSQASSEQATIAYQASEALTPAPVASTAATAGKRRLPASFAKRPDAPVAKKGSANRNETPPKPATVDGAGPAKDRGKGQVQTKLSFQATPKKEKPGQDKSSIDKAGAGKLLPRRPHVARQQPPASQPLSAQDMLDMTDAELLRLCGSAINAATAGSAGKGGPTQTVSSTAPGPVLQSLAPSEQTLQPQSVEKSKSLPTQPSSLLSRDPDTLAEEAIEQTQKRATEMTTLGSADNSTLSRSRSEDAGSYRCGQGGGATASTAPDAGAGLLTREAGASKRLQQLPLPGGPPAARSMLEELLGDTFHLLADPAPKADEQQTPVEEASAMCKPGSEAADSSFATKQGEVPATCLSSAGVEAEIDEIVGSTGCTQAERAQANLRLGRSHLPHSQTSLQGEQQTLLAPQAQPDFGSDLSMQQPEQRPAGRKLTLRERVRLLKESGSMSHRFA